MPLDYKLGKKPRVADHRVPFFSAHTAGLPPPPPNSNWWADVGNWMMFGNDTIGCCAEAAAYHALLQLSSYAETPYTITDADVIGAYSAITGYDPANPDTDQGTAILGPGGLMEYWTQKGLKIASGNLTNKVQAYMQMRRPTVTTLMQAVQYFGGFMLGFLVPANVMQSESLPFVWNDPSPPYEGGHEVYVCGYETVGSGYVLFDFVTWGARCRMTLDFLEKTAEEVVVLYDDACLNKAGLDGAGFSRDQLLADMQLLKGGK